MDTSEWTTQPSGVDPRTLLAPEAFVALARLERAVWQTPRPELVELARQRVAMLLGEPAEQAHRPEGTPVLDRTAVAALAAWPTAPQFTETDRAVLAFTEQFVMDVAGVTDADRAALGAQLTPEELGGFVLSLYVVDYGIRARMAMARLFPEAGPLATPPDAADDRPVDLGGAFDTMLKTIALLDALDPVTTELVRLRGAGPTTAGSAMPLGRWPPCARGPTSPPSTRSTPTRTANSTRPPRRRCA